MARAALTAAIERWGGDVQAWDVQRHAGGSARVSTPRGAAVDVWPDGAWLVLEPVEPTLPLFLWIRWRASRPGPGSPLARAYGWQACGVGFLQIGGGSVLQAWLARPQIEFDGMLVIGPMRSALKNSAMSQRLR